MPSFHTKDEHFLRLQKNLVNLSQSLVLLSLMAMIPNRPDQSQTQVLLIHVLQTSLHFVYDIDRLHDIVIDLIKVCLDNGLKRFDIFGFLDNLQDGRPAML